MFSNEDIEDVVEEEELEVVPEPEPEKGESPKAVRLESGRIVFE